MLTIKKRKTQSNFLHLQWLMLTKCNIYFASSLETIPNTFNLYNDKDLLASSVGVSNSTTPERASNGLYTRSCCWIWDWQYWWSHIFRKCIWSIAFKVWTGKYNCEWISMEVKLPSDVSPLIPSKSKHHWEPQSIHVIFPFFFSLTLNVILYVKTTPYISKSY